MILVPFSSEFASLAREYATAERDSGIGAEEALRRLEMFCAKNLQEFHPDGPALIEELYADRGGLPEQRYVSGIAVHEQVSAEPAAAAGNKAKAVASEEKPATVSANEASGSADEVDDATVTPATFTPDDPDEVVEKLEAEGDADAATSGAPAVGDAKKAKKK